jgi:hypothetical protein
MSTGTWRDSRHNIIGYVETKADGKQVVRDPSYNVKTYYDPGTDQTRDDGIGSLILLLLGMALVTIIGAVSWAWQQINNYSSLDAPYRFIAHYYFYMVVLPIKFGCTVFSLLHGPGFTKYANLNLVIAIGGVAGYAAAAFVVLFLLVRRSAIRRWSAAALFFGPATCALIYFAGSAALHWLLAPA